MKKLIQPYHLVTPSPWPLLMSLSIFIEFLGIYLFFIYSEIKFMMFGIFLICLIMFCWWRDVIRESTFQGFHTTYVVKGLKLGMMIFIFSEVMFFFSIFFSYFYSFLSPDVWIGSMWPPAGVEKPNIHVALYATVLLLSSGVHITCCHHSIIAGNKKLAMNMLIASIFEGLLFLRVQYIEYWTNMFTMSDSVYGSIFYLCTGFHGLHVCIGVLFLFIMLIRMMKNHFSSNHFVGLEMAIWYWHFVDLVWLFLFLSIYVL
uniref:Cytochrome c oxidase subunit 3 n=1 Tax=Wiebesia pumilae TaxID=150944 RepID=A0A8A3UX18_9HYME|nr:cytochrome c oxidase subunit III [Wiebesia pumilae]